MTSVVACGVWRGAVEGLRRHRWDLLIEDARLSSTAYRLFTIGAAASGGLPSLGVGGGGRSA